MHDVGPWIESPQMIEDCLVGDFSGQANVLRREPASRWAHEGVAPMSWRSQHVGDATRRGPQDEIARRFAGSRQHHRSAAEERAQKNLQAAITADVVEGAPQHLLRRRAVRLDRTRQAQPRVYGNAPPPRPAGGEQLPSAYVPLRPPKA